MNKTPIVFPLLVGLLTPLATTTIARLGSLENWYFLVICFVYFLAAMSVSYRYKKGFQLQLVIIYLLSPVGSFIDATLDHFTSGAGRNLWGMEVIALLLLTPIPLVFGVLAGRALSGRVKKLK